MSKKDKISAHVSYEEATKSQTATRKGIDNTPDQSQLKAMKQVSKNIFEKVRHRFGDNPIAITSFFRSVALNTAIGGSKSSQHCKGEAIDIDADVFGRMTNSQIFEYINEKLDFDQVIWEFGDNEEPGWVHVSCKMDASKNRNRALVAVRIKGKTKYFLWSDRESAWRQAGFAA